MKNLVLISVVLIVASVLAYKKIIDKKPASPVQAVHVEKLVLKGSNTVGEKFAPQLAKSFLRELGAVLVKSTTGKSWVDKIISGSIPQKNTRIDIEIYAHGSSTGFIALEEDSTDIAMSSRAIKTNESEKLTEQYGVVKEYPVALDALAIVVDPNNPIKRLSIAQIADLFSGKIVNWKQLSGLDQPVKIFARDDNSGTWDTFKHLVLKPYSKTLSGSAKRFESSGELVAQTVATAGGIGFVGASFISGAPIVKVSRDKLDEGAKPDIFTIGTLKYALSRKLYMYSVQQKPKPIAQAFIDFVNSNKGQSIADDVDLVSYFPTYDRPSIDSRSPTKYKELASLGLRLTVQFSSNKTKNQDIEQRDIRRLKQYIRQYPGKKLILVGLSNNTSLGWLIRLFDQANLPVLDTMNFNSGQNKSDIEVWAI